MKPQRGNAIVEFAILAPILILLTLGTIELGRYAYFAILVSNAAQAGADYGSQDIGTAYDATGIANAIAADASPNPIASVTANPAPEALYGCYDTTNASLAVAPTPGATPCSGTETPVPYVIVSAQGTLKPLFDLPFIKKTGITVKTTIYRRVQCQFASGAGCQ
jgi:Flp pilus assembly protein TadG